METFAIILLILVAAEFIGLIILSDRGAYWKKRNKITKEEYEIIEYLRQIDRDIRMADFWLQKLLEIKK